MYQECGAGGTDFLIARHPRCLVGPAWGGLRDGSPVTAVDGRQVHLVTRYEQACEVLTSSRWSRAAAGRREIGPAAAMSVTELDPPLHTRIRGFLGQAFAPRRVDRLRPDIVRRATALLAEFRAAGPVADLVSRFCVPFTFAVQCDLLGVPEPARALLHQLSVARSGRPGITDAEQRIAELRLHEAVVAVLIGLRGQDSPQGPQGQGLFGMLLAARDRGELTETELTGIASSMFFDGHILAAAQLAQAALCLLTQPTVFREVRDNGALIPTVIEEVLRWSPAITLGMTRVDTTSPGCAVSVAFGLVNRDQAVFDGPESFVGTRQPNRHLSFGRGVHHCLGAHLMRVELHVVLAMLVQELPGLRLAIPDQALGWTASRTVRSLDSLPLRWNS